MVTTMLAWFEVSDIVPSCMLANQRVQGAGGPAIVADFRRSGGAVKTVSPRRGAEPALMRFRSRLSPAERRLDGAEPRQTIPGRRPASAISRCVHGSGLPIAA